MKRITFVIIIIIIAVTALYSLIAKSPSENEMPAPKPDHKLFYSGSIPYFGAEAGIASFKENFQKLGNINIFWYQLANDGMVLRQDEVKEKAENDVLAFAKQNQIKVSVGIDNGGEKEKVEPLLENEEARKEHIAQVLSLLSEKGYDGMVVDFEGLEQNQSKDFTNYIKDLTSALHAQGKTVTVAIEIETEGRVFHGMDIVDIAKLADRVEISTYEEYGEETGPGPIASIDWVNAIIKNIVDQGVQKDKIIMGTAHSSHDWITNSDTEFIADESAIKGLGKLSSFNSELKWDDKRQSSFFEYEEGDNKHVVWLEDARAFKSKIDLAKSYELAGIFIWYLGGEDPAIWNSI